MTAREDLVRPLVENLARSARRDAMSRREFIATASTFGASAAAAYGLLGLKAPVHAQSSIPQKGGVVRIGMRVLALTEPRLQDWDQANNVSRQFLEPLVRWELDYSFSGVLLDSWDVSDDAKTYTLHLRTDALWNNGDAFTADDVVFNIERWCDKTVEGNSMASRFAALVDEETQKARAGGIEKIDDHTVRLNLPRPDITLIAAMADHPALLIHPSFQNSIVDTPIGTGPFELVSHEVGVKAVLKRRESGWWGGQTHLDGVEFIDFGTEPMAIVSAFEAGEIHVNDETSGDIIEVLDALGLVRKEKPTAGTIVARMRSDSAPYDNPDVRRAVQMAVDNSVVLELGVNSAGVVAENHHCAPFHPEYADIGAPEYDPVKAREMLIAAGHAETELELISLDGDWRQTTSDAIGAQLRDAGFNIKRTIIPGATFWNDWTKYPFSTTNWGARPLGVQVYGLAYKSGEPWNESGFSDPDFDAKLEQALGIADAEKRRPLMAEMQQILREAGVIIQPFWQSQNLHHVPQLMGYERHQQFEVRLDNVWLDEA
ncbi:ABC transporter substrate-binding protein [Defluviimonas sp. WL0024]|uniref:ABC transporter substrate-binding protein n=1 Tax=Albidovulum salinarum TaxID=2984153 RepID=A0ABT2X8H9_9RHOB|nr:ABC transporter substrate-binding protein [Defluviimonas sp. WL0024]MCU9850257.1 ABC transporter substrate-binding protein [Defluviimonas sp. WL0024]